MNKIVFYGKEYWSKMPIEENNDLRKLMFDASYVLCKWKTEAWKENLHSQLIAADDCLFYDDRSVTTRTGICYCFYDRVPEGMKFDKEIYE